MTDSALPRWLPAILAVVTVSMAAGAGQWQLGAMAADLSQQGQDIDANEDAIQEIQRQLIRRQGAVELDLQKIQIEQQSQEKTLDEILRILKETRGD